MSAKTRGNAIVLIAALAVMLANVACAFAQERRPAHGAPADVLAGADVLKRDNYKQLEGRKIALVTNQTGRDREGNRLPELLASAKNLKLVVLLAPEHGLYGTQDEKIKDTVDPKTKVPVLSIYGETRKPSKKMLEGCDTIVYDLQDIGARFYTVSATLGLCLEAAAENKMKLVILDRPNPITGLICDGPIADKDKLNFVAYAQMPVAHGMTMGELAKYYNAELKIGADLEVVACEGWKRDMWFDETNLLWGNSSPNMRNTTAALLYTGVCLLEQTNVSVGRGTNQPFEFFGAPYIDGRKLAPALNALDLPGVRFVPVQFTPEASKFKGEPCGGCYVIVTDRDKINPVQMGIAIVWQIQQLYGDTFKIDGVNRLLKSDKTLKALKEAKDWKTIPAGWADDLATFKSARAKYLQY